MNSTYIWIAVLIVATVTAAIRFLPFVVFGGTKKTPAIIDKLGKSLPYAVMGMLVVYCLKGVNISRIEGFVPELIACVVVFLVHIFKRNTLLSIVAGTVCYMILVQMVF